MRSALLAGIAMLAAAGCNGMVNAGTPVQASGTTSQRSFQVGAFERVSSAGPYDVIVTVGGQPSVSAEGDSALLERTEIFVENGRLRIKLQDGYNWSGDTPATVRVTAPALAAADVAGSGDMRVGGFQAASFSGSVAGAGNLTLERLQAQDVSFDIAGSGNIDARGSAREASVDVAGSGNARLAGFQTQTASLSIAGSGNVEINASASASGSVAGSGNVTVTGGARCQVSKVGSGEVNCG